MKAPRQAHEMLLAVAVPAAAALPVAIPQAGCHRLRKTAVAVWPDGMARAGRRLWPKGWSAPGEERLGSATCGTSCAVVMPVQLTRLVASPRLTQER